MLDFNDHPSTTSALLARFGRATYRVGFAFPRNSAFLTHAVDCPSHERTHITERLRKIPEAIGLEIKPAEIVPHIALGAEERDEAAAALKAKAGSRPAIAVNVSAGHPSRYWQTEKWNAFLRQAMLLNPTWVFVVLRAPGDAIDLDRIVEGVPGERILIPAELGFHLFASYISLSRLLISPDTSAVHIASAFKVPVLGLYPAVHWNLVSWHPIGTEYEVVTPSSGLVPEIGVEAVVRGFQRLVERIGRNHF
jgi:ADP-heptose:LPS heptosyltransferase